MTSTGISVRNENVFEAIDQTHSKKKEPQDITGIFNNLMKMETI